MSGNRLFKLRWKKKDFNRKGPFPYSFFHKEDKLESFRGPDGYPLLVPSLRNTTEYAKRYRDQVKNAEIEKIENVHLKMLEFRKSAKKRYEIKSSNQSYNALPYWLFATRTKLMRGLPLEMQRSACSISDEVVDSLNDSILVAIREYLLPNSVFREKFDDRTNKHFASFLKSIAFSISNHPEISSELGSDETFFNQNVETIGFFGKDENMYQVTDEAAIAQLRSKHPLVPLESLDSEICQYSPDQIPELPHSMQYYEELVWENPKVKMPRRGQQWIKKRVPVKTEVQDAVIFSGVKPGSLYQYFHTQFLLNSRPSEFWREDSDFYAQEVTDCKTLLNMHSTLSSTAWYLKFTPFQDLTMPLSLNAMTYDGTQNVSFYNYQLNTVASGKMMLDEFLPEASNPRANVLWSTEMTPLFSYDETTGSVDINNEAVKCMFALLKRKTAAQKFEVPESSWDEGIPEGIPLVRVDRDVDPGKIWIKPKKSKNWPKGWYHPKYKWNPQYVERMEREKEQGPFYESEEDHSEFIKEFNSKQKLIK